MTTYEKLIVAAEEDGCIVKEKNLVKYDGLIQGNRIAIRSTIPTEAEKACVLAEEIGHYHTGYGNILCQDDIMNRKQEYRGRLYGANLTIGLYGIVSAAKAKCTNQYEVAQHLNVPEWYLAEALKMYENKYGAGVALDNYWIMFTPYLQVFEYMPMK